MNKRALNEPITGEATEAEEREINELEDSFEARYTEARVNMRWNQAALRVIQQAAENAGVPYQTYIKMVTYRQALADLRDAKAASAA